MWKPRSMSTARGDYEIARTSEDRSDAQTLADDDEWGHSSGREGAKAGSHDDDLSLDDPLDDRHPSHSNNWATSAGMNRWRLRSSPPSPLDLTEKEEDEGAVGLMNDERNVALVGGAAVSPRRATAGQLTVSWLVWPLPSFTHHYFGVRYPEEPRRPTDYLDGLRGVASLCVFICHYLLRVQPNLVHEGYGHGPNNYSFIQLPLIRLFHSGGAMVAIFFIISGYVLSQRCIVAMRAGDHTKLHTALTSMTFRRAIRLFLPSIAISLVCLVMVLFGFLLPEFTEDWSWAWEFENYHFHLFYDLFRLWNWEISFDFWYARQLWTIPTEYRCSMVLFLFILMVARTTTFVRLAMGFATITYMFYIDRWDVALFLTGMFIAEINLIFSDYLTPGGSGGGGGGILGGSDAEKPWFPRFGRRCCCGRWRKSTLFLTGTIVVGAWLAGYPDSDGVNTPGYGLIPEFEGFWPGDFSNYRFWVAIGSTMILLPISFLPVAQALFTTPVARYLGKISYALYLVHELMAVTVRVTVLNIVWGILGYDAEVDAVDSFAFRGGWVIGFFFYLPFVLWAADIFWRAVDVPTVKFAKWFESKCFVPSR